ncbi:MAG: deoxyguanosinetriphosphate triphosphohydrolase [Thermodesulfobacteriota bacterium]|nr:deoxyguanosinetriphosphate triphosphohydrolase [Thermodesulfobacteriota bacterium]
MRCIRERLEELEKAIFCPYATFSSASRGRRIPDKQCELRPIFQHDRDRIIHSKAFRRLKHKTQVFLSPTGDHYRTRLTHTLEVSQIARTIAKSMLLNQDLTEAISLGHDIGHTPFGHAGEEVLNEIHPGGFRHAEQSLRVVDVLEKDGKGLNLSFEVRDGILKHSKGSGVIITKEPDDCPITPEGQVVRIADIIAYLSHDLDDALRGGIIKPGDIPEECTKILGDTHAKRIDTMIKDVVKNVLKGNSSVITMSDEILTVIINLRKFLYDRVYFSKEVHNSFIKAAKILKELYYFFIKNQDFFKKEAGHPFAEFQFQRGVCDFIAGMTDRYAFNLYEKIFLPHPWQI